MYEFIDRTVTDLDNGSRLLIWSMRSWVASMGERKCPASIVAEPFRKWNMLAGLQPFLRTMAILNHRGLENFQFCSPCCNHISEHEAILVSLVCCMGEGQAESARQTLELLVEEDAVGELFVTLSALGRNMAMAGIHPERPMENPAFPAPRPHRPDHRR